MAQVNAALGDIHRPNRAGSRNPRLGVPIVGQRIVVGGAVRAGDPHELSKVRDVHYNRRKCRL